MLLWVVCIPNLLRDCRVTFPSRFQAICSVFLSIPSLVRISWGQGEVDVELNEIEGEVRLVCSHGRLVAIYRPRVKNKLMQRANDFFRLNIQSSQARLQALQFA
jgi:hypothetical protein